jgi:hypothetical protein
VSTSVTSATISGSTLTITTSGGGVFSYQLSGQQSNTGLLLQSDGSGGTDLQLTPINPPPPANTTEAMFLRDSVNGDYERSTTSATTRSWRPVRWGRSD